MKHNRFSPAETALIVLRLGLPPIALLFAYIFFHLRTADGTELLSACREGKIMLEHALMSLAVLLAGAAAFEHAAHNRY